MIVGSVLLVIAAGVLLGFGLVRLSESLLYSAIGVSALAAFTLAVGVRRLAAVRAGRGTIAVRPLVAPPRPIGRATPRPVGRATVGPPPSGDGRYPADPPVLAEIDVVADDEPAPEPARPAELARLDRLDTPVMVVDGRPRFHLSGCGHVTGRDAEPLPVAEAVEAGFTPCGACRPVTFLLTDVDDTAGGSSD